MLFSVNKRLLHFVDVNSIPLVDIESVDKKIAAVTRLVGLTAVN
jgi:hypothetical protein